MKKKLGIILFFKLIGVIQAQVSNEKFPVFAECENIIESEKEICFYNTLQKFIYKNFKSTPQPNEVKGTIYAIIEVDTIGNFKPIYIDAPSKELKIETENIIQKLPQVKPATYLGRNIYKKFNLKIEIPLQEPTPYSTQEKLIITNNPNPIIDNAKELTEFDEVSQNYQEFQNPQFKSNSNIPFSHQNYSLFDAYINQVGSNNHTATKPYSYADVAKYYDFEAVNKSLLKDKKSWWGRKLWNENLVAIQGKNYWFTLDPIIDLRVGKDMDSDISNTFVNTRGLFVQGGLGKEISFSASVYESQGRFADYYNTYAESIKPSGGNPAIIPGIGIAKEFKENAYDFPLAEAYITYKPSEIFDFQLGYGRNFIGDGYRSLLQGDGVSPYPYFKINTTFWKIKYTNTYMWLKDVRPDVTVDGSYATKYMASHYLSYNISKRINIGLYENVVWAKSENRGFDASFINPIIFYRAVEFNSSSKSGNAVLAATAKYKLNNQINFYGQFLIDEFSIGDVKAGEKSWANKSGYQIGVKYYDAFKITNLKLQLEYNRIRPYVYSHSDPITNYAHQNLSMGHQWGGNLQELIGIIRYTKGRIFGEAKVIYGQKGFDFNTTEDSYNYGGNMFLNYEENRPYDIGATVAQGNKTNIFIGELQVGYVINPMTNLKVFGHALFRNFDPLAETATIAKNNTTWLSIGIRSDLFNWYFDY